MCAQVAPSGECLRRYKPRAADRSRLAPRVAASCLAKPSCYTWPAQDSPTVLVVLSCVAACVSMYGSIQLQSCKCVNLHAARSPSSTMWYRPKGSDAGNTVAGLWL